MHKDSLYYFIYTCLLSFHSFCYVSLLSPPFPCGLSSSFFRPDPVHFLSHTHGQHFLIMQNLSCSILFTFVFSPFIIFAIHNPCCLPCSAFCFSSIITSSSSSHTHRVNTSSPCRIWARSSWTTSLTLRRPSVYVSTRTDPSTTCSRWDVDQEVDGKVDRQAGDRYEDGRVDRQEGGQTRGWGRWRTEQWVGRLPQRQLQHTRNIKIHRRLHSQID